MEGKWWSWWVSDGSGLCFPGKTSEWETTAEVSLAGKDLWWLPKGMRKQNDSFAFNWLTGSRNITQLKVPERQELKYLSKGWQRQAAGPWHSSCLLSFLSSIPGNWALDTEIELRCRKIKQMSCLASWVWADTPCTTLSSVLPGKQVVPVSQAGSWRKHEDGEQDVGCPSFSRAWFWGVLFLLFRPSRTRALESPSQGTYFSLALNLTPWLDLEPHFPSLRQRLFFCT